MQRWLEEFYSDLEIEILAVNLGSDHNLIILGDFNSQIRVRLHGEAKFVGNYGFGKRNERGEK